MHEHGVAKDLLNRLAPRLMRGHEQSRVRTLHFSVREGSGIDPHFLEHGLEEESPATFFQGARFHVTERPLTLVCASCGEPIMDDAIDERCIHCGGSGARPEGDEIQFDGVIWDES